MDMGEKMEIQRPENLNPETRERLEAAVLDIFSETDFHRAGIREVAKKAGVSFSSIYNYYGSKEKLLFSCVDSWLKELCERMIDHLKGIENLKEKLRKVFWLQLDFYERNPGVGKILFLTIPYNKWMSDDTFKQRRMINLFLDVISGGQKEGSLNPNVGPEVLLDMFYGFVHRRFTMWVYRGQKENMTDNANVLFELIWKGISNPENAKRIV